MTTAPARPRRRSAAKNGSTPADANGLFQLALFQTERLVPKNEKVSLDLLPPNDEIVGEPGENLDNMDEAGLIIPIVVVRNTDGRHRLADGGRRTKRARALGWTEIDARVYDTDLSVREVLTLIANTGRNENEATEAEAVKRMLLRGYAPNVVRDMIGMDKKLFDRRILIATKLIEPLFEALRNGRLDPSVAEAAARLSNPLQEVLAALLQQQGRLTGKDVKNARDEARAQQPQQASMLPDAPEDDVESFYTWLGGHVLALFGGTRELGSRAFVALRRAYAEAVELDRDENDSEGVFIATLEDDSKVRVRIAPQIQFAIADAVQGITAEPEDAGAADDEEEDQPTIGVANVDG